MEKHEILRRLTHLEDLMAGAIVLDNDGSENATGAIMPLLTLMHGDLRDLSGAIDRDLLDNRPAQNATPGTPEAARPPSVKAEAIEDINVCHGALSDAFAVNVTLEELAWELLNKDDQTPDVIRTRYRVHAATMALSAALRPWSDALGPADDPNGKEVAA